MEPIIMELLDNVNILYNRKNNINTLFNLINKPVYYNLIQKPQKQSLIIGKNQLEVSTEFSKNSLEILQKNKSNPHIIRIMTYNIFHWGPWSDLDPLPPHKIIDIANSGGIFMLNNILNIMPDILCLQEFIDLPTSGNVKLLEVINRFNELYENVGECKADFNLFNAVYVLRDKKFTINVFNNKYHNIEYGDDARCGVFIDISHNGIPLFSLANIHLHNGSSINRVGNLEKTLELIKLGKSKNKIIVGDFNSYRQKDYPGNMIGELEEVKGKKYYGSDENMFGAINHIEKIGWTESFAKYFIDNNINDNEHQYPINTTRYGGRIDFMYFNKEWDIPIVGTYNLYSNASDHTPIITDLYFNTS